MVRLVVFACLAAHLHSQVIPIWTLIRAYTTFTLPAAGVVNRVAVVTNAASTSSCTSGGGTTVVLCRDNGSSWSPLGGGGSSSGASWGAITGTLSAQTDLQSALNGKITQAQSLTLVSMRF